MSGDIGSSPLARGLHVSGFGDCSSTRIIPARAGFTLGIDPNTNTDTDHPRSRGVYIPLPVRDVPTAGSSPLARGLPSRPPRGGREDRIIPARAGFTATRLSRRGDSRDHPRSRGVYVVGSGTVSRNSGSSPLARGLLALARGPYHWTRIIPARAGFTRHSTHSSWSPQDHPRSRGVYYALTTPLVVPIGSSPLARGLRFPGTAHWRNMRIIPARAGFTRASGCSRRP